MNQENVLRERVVNVAMALELHAGGSLGVTCPTPRGPGEEDVKGREAAKPCTRGNGGGDEWIGRSGGTNAHAANELPAVNQTASKTAGGKRWHKLNGESCGASDKSKISSESGGGRNVHYDKENSRTGKEWQETAGKNMHPV